MENETLLARTLALLKERRASVPLPRIASETGLHYEWLKKLAYGQIPDPGVTKIERLYAYLTGATAATTAIDPTEAA